MFALADRLDALFALFCSCTAFAFIPDCLSSGEATRALLGTKAFIPDRFSSSWAIVQVSRSA